MNPINNVGGNNPVSKVTANPVSKQTPATGADKPSLADRVELSGVGHLLSALKTNDIRADKVSQIKSQIEAGTYEDDNKLNAAVDKLLEDLTK